MKREGGRWNKTTSDYKLYFLGSVEDMESSVTMVSLEAQFIFQLTHYLLVYL